MAKIGGKNENTFRIIKIGREYLPILFRHFSIDGASHDGDNFYFLLPKSLRDVWQMHLDRVLILFVVDINHMEPFLFFQFVHSCIPELLLSTSTSSGPKGVAYWSM